MQDEPVVTQIWVRSYKNSDRLHGSWYVMLPLDLALVLIQWGQFVYPSSQYTFLEVVGGCFQLVSGMGACRHAEDLVEFFQSKCLCLGHEEESCESSKDVPRCEPREHTLRSPRAQQSGHSERDDKVAWVR